MNTEYENMSFHIKTKSEVWVLKDKKGKAKRGTVFFDEARDGYVFDPAVLSPEFDAEQLHAIQHFISQLTEQRTHGSL